MQEKQDCDILKEHIKRVTDPIFQKVLQETLPNRTLVGQPGLPESDSCYVDIHNCRLYFDFSKINFDPNSFIKPGFHTKHTPGLYISYGTKNHNSEHLFQFENFNFIVKKTQIEILNKIENRKKHKIEYSEEGHNKIIDLCNQKVKESKEALAWFTSVFGGGSSHTMLKIEPDIKFHRDFAVDLMDIKSTWHNEIGKKVYHEKVLEINHPAYASNFVLNQGILKVSPHIAEELFSIKMMIHPVKTLKLLIHSVNDVCKWKDTIINLTYNEKKQLESWIFDKFGVSA